MPPNRTRFRNVTFYNGATGATLGGLRQNGSVTEANFLWMLNHILLIPTTPLFVKDRVSGREILPTDNRLEHGTYDVYCETPIIINNEPWIYRIYSHSVSGREDGFCEGVRARDGKCVISGVVNESAPYEWDGFEAAHIFPLEKETLWIQHSFQRWITDMDDTMGNSKINSYQNGLLIRGDLHTAFNNYSFSINPDDNYKITAFRPDSFGIDGRVLEPICRDPANSHRVSDELLRWHFHQSVLANMRGAGEPIFEHDFPPGTDIIKEISGELYSKERFEMEIASRLRHLMERE